MKPTPLYTPEERMFQSSSCLMMTTYRVADKSLAQPTSPRILFDGENISFDVSLILYI